LTVVGCHPEIEGEAKSFTRVVGFLRKSSPEDSEMLGRLYLSATALLVPSQAECFGCVYCEASAYGLPAIARDTGGVSAAVIDGKMAC
jgi:glycosyltransferase involved in cell wall biosynthesis